MNQKIPFHQLSSRIAAATGISEESAENFVKNFFEILSEELIKGETVKIKGLGEFSLYDENESGEKNIRFTSDKDLAETLNAPFAMFEPVTLNDEVTESMLSVEEAEETPAESDKTDDDNFSGQSAETEVVTECHEPVIAIEKKEETTEEPESSDDSPTEAESIEAEAEADVAPNIEQKAEQTQPQPEIAQQPEAAPKPEPVIVKPTAKQPVTRPVAPKIAPLEEEPEVFVTTDKSHSSEGNFWWGLIIGLIIGLAVGACGVYLAIDHLFPGGRPHGESPKAEVLADTPSEEAETETTQLTDTVTSEKGEAEAAPAPATEPAAEPAVAESSSPKMRKDTVRRGYLIHDMAKKFFGSKDYWVYIYEENKSKIGNPNNMQPGVVLDIPAAEKYGIVPGNAESLKKARQKAGEILAKYPR